MKKLKRIEIHMTPEELKRYSKFLCDFNIKFRNNYKLLDLGKIPYILHKALILYYCLDGKPRHHFTGVALQLFAAKVVVITWLKPRKPEEDVNFVFEDDSPKRTLFD